MSKEKLQQNHETIALNILFVPHNIKTIRLVVLLITDGKKWHYLALKSVRTNRYNRPVRSLSKLLRGISSNHVRDYYCLNCFHSKSTNNALKKHKRC